MTTPRTGFGYLDEPIENGAVLALAHRGGALHPDLVGLENTRKAFATAVGLGYRYLETDVHATSDGELLAFHDPLLDRVTDLAGRVAEKAYDVVATALVGSREPIPRLADLLEEFPDARFNIDLKSSAAVDPLIGLIRSTGTYDRVFVGCFSEKVLRRFRARLGADRARVATSAGVVTVAALKGNPRLARLWRDSGAALQVPHRYRGLRIVDRRFVEQAHASGRHVHVWTVNERAEMEYLLDLGVDGLITDRTDVLKAVLVGRRLWEGTA